jgi:hypothetical protein
MQDSFPILQSVSVLLSLVALILLTGALSICFKRFQPGTWKTSGIILGSILGWILFHGYVTFRTGAPAGPLRERGYLWQRNWTPAVAAGFLEAERRMDGVVVLGAEITWADGAAHTVRANIDWETLRGEPVSLAVRVAPFAGPFSLNAGPYPEAAAEVTRLLKEAAAHGVKPAELQLDFDCAARKLAGYSIWVGALRRIAAPVPLVITALPSWLDERDFPALARAADEYVLQVHSVPTLAETGHAVLCDPALARKWVAKASRLGIPFSVSLPAYWCVAGYDGQGRLLGVAMDSVQPAWPPGTSALEFAANADDIAALVAAWRQSRPPWMRDLLWYRVPVATDRRNWRWPTLAAVMAGRDPVHRLDIVTNGKNPVDISIVNRGEAEERTPCTVTLTSTGASVTASDVLPGWNMTADKGRVVFSTPPGQELRLSPGDVRSIGWIRYDQDTVPRWQVDERSDPAR